MEKDETATEPNIALDFTAMQQQAWAEVKSYLGKVDSTRKYKREQIEQFLDNPEKYERQIREASLHFSTVSSHYMRLVLYLSKMLTLNHIIVPQGITKKDTQESAFQKNYDKAVEFMETFNVKHELGKALVTMLLEDTFFGYERRVGKSFMIQKLPHNYCKITGMEDGLYTFSFNMSYFNANKSKLRNYPTDFTDLYRAYEKTREQWQPLDTNKAVCFKLREDLTYSLPFFSGTFEEILDLEDAKALIKSKDMLENFKLLLQKIPFKKDPKTEKDMIIGLKSVRVFHDNIKSVLPEQIGLISSPMEIEEFSFERKNNALKNSEVDAKDGIFDSAGISSGLFNSGDKSSVTLNRAIEVDESIMFGVLRQFERFFNRRLGQVTSRTYTFKVIFPDLTVYNEDDMLDKYLKTAQHGFPKSLVASAMGLSTSQLMGLNVLENDYMNLDEMLVPLSSTHTMSASDSEGGAPKKKDSELGDKGAETRDTEGNENRV